MNFSRLRALRAPVCAAFSLVIAARAATGDPDPGWTMVGANASHNGRVPDSLGDGNFLEVWRHGPFAGNLNHFSIAGGLLHATVPSTTTSATAVSTLDSRLGVLRWSRKLGSKLSISPPALGSGLLYLRHVPTGGGPTQHLALNPATGANAWETINDAGGGEGFSFTPLPSGIFFNTSGFLGSQQPDTGTQVFRVPVSPTGVRSTPTWDGNLLYSLFGGVLRAYDPADGTTRWTLTIDPALLNHSAVVAHDAGRIFIASSRGLHAVDTTTRQLAWAVSTPSTGTPAVADGVVYAIRSSGATIDARSAADGTLLGSFSTGSANATQLIITSDALVAVTASNTLVFRRDGTGTPRTLPFGGVAAVQDGALFIGEAKGTSSRVLCFRSARSDDLPPTAAAVTASVTEDQPATFALAGQDPEGAPLVAVIESLPAKGTLCLTTDGVTPGPVITSVPTTVDHPGLLLIYQPPPDEYGQAFASFRFRVSDGRYSSAASVVTLNVAGANDPPVAVADQLGGLAGEWIHGFQPEANDHDLDGERPEFVSFTRPRKGTLVRQPDGSLSYLPNELFLSGTDRFDYTVRDAAGMTSTASVTITVGPPVRRDWPTFGNGPAHTGATDERFPPADLEERWVASQGVALNQAAVAAGRVYLTSADSRFANNWLVALDEVTGATAWHRDLTFNSPGNYVNPPTFHRGRIYLQRGAGSGLQAPSDSRLWCFEASDGATVWSAPFASQWQRYLAPCPSDDGIHINGGSNGGLYGLSASSGAQLFFRSSNLGSDDLSTPAYANGEVYYSAGTVFRAVDPQSGEVRWALTPGGTGGNSNTIAIDGGRAFSMQSGGVPIGVSLTCIDLTSKKVAWRVQRGFSPEATPAAAGGVVYGIAGSKIEALSAATGLHLGTYAADQPLLSHPVVAGNRVFASSANKTYVFNRDSRALLQTIPHGGLLSLANRTLFIAGADGRIRAWAAPRPGNLPPAADPLTASTAEDTAVTLAFAGNDPDGDPLHVTIAFLPSSGSIFQTSDGITKGLRIDRVPASVPGPLPRIIYQPAADVHGPALGRFSYLVSDGESESPAASVMIDVLPVNDPPVAVGNRFLLRPGEILSPLLLLANDLDPEGQDLTVSSFTQPENGVVRRNDDGTLRFEAPATGGEFSFTYTVMDAAGETSSATVELVVAENAAADWTTFGNGPEHAGFAPINHPTGPWALQWATPLGVALNQAAVAEGLVFVTPSGSGFTSHRWCKALDAGTGAQRWMLDMTGAGVGHDINPPTWFDGRLYVQGGRNPGGLTAILWCVTAASGTVAWQAPFDEQSANYYAPAVSSLGVFINGGTWGGIFGFEPATGARRFFSSRPQFDQWTPSIHRGELFSFVAGNFVRHNPDTGAVIWSLALPWQTIGSSSMNRTVAFAGNLAFLVNNSPDFGVAQELVCIDLDAREVRWRIQGDYAGTPAVADGMVYAIRDGRSVAAHRVADGSPRGVFPTGATIGVPSVQPQPLVTNDQLIVAIGSGTYVFDRYSYKLLQVLPHFGPPSLADGRLVIAGSNGVVATYALPPAVAFSPPGGDFPSSTLAVTLSAYDPTARIHYTTDGTAPQFSSPSLPSGGQVTISEYTHLRAITVSGAKVSGIHQATYNLAVPQAAGALAPEVAGDSDGDGRGDSDESLAGTDPADSGDFFHASIRLEPDGTGIVMEWNSVSGRQYRIEASPDLATWQPVSDWLPATGVVMKSTVPHPAGSSSARRFFRVVVARAAE